MGSPAPQPTPSLASAHSGSPQLSGDVSVCLSSGEGPGPSPPSPQPGAAERCRGRSATSSPRGPGDKGQLGLCCRGGTLPGRCTPQAAGRARGRTVPQDGSVVRRPSGGQGSAERMPVRGPCSVVWALAPDREDDGALCPSLAWETWAAVRRPDRATGPLPSLESLSSRELAPQPCGQTVRLQPAGGLLSAGCSGKVGQRLLTGPRAAWRPPPHLQPPAQPPPRGQGRGLAHVSLRPLSRPGSFFHPVLLPPHGGLSPRGNTVPSQVLLALPGHIPLSRVSQSCSERLNEGSASHRRPEVTGIGKGPQRRLTRPGGALGTVWEQVGGGRGVHLLGTR